MASDKKEGKAARDAVQAESTPEPSGLRTQGDDTAPRAAMLSEDSGADSAPLVLAHRVDALVLAYRLRLSTEAAAALRDAMAGAVKYGLGELRILRPNASGRDAVDWCEAMVNAPRSERLTFQNADLRGTFVEALATGDADGELGWSLELTARAIFLARAGLETVIAELRVWAAAFGHMLEERVRRVDLAVDLERWTIRDDDAERFVRHPRSTMTSFALHTKTYREQSKHVTGHVVCPGNPLMLRIYDKTAELEAHGAAREGATKRALERAIWLEGGWQGGQVTRVEFQVRGEACQELFKRSLDRLTKELDSLWRYCIGWVRIVDPDTGTRLRRCELDPRWQALHTVTWGATKQVPMRRTRFRGMATAAQAWSTMMAALGEAGETSRIDDATKAAMVERAATDEATALQVAREFAQALADKFVGVAVAAAWWRWGPVEAVGAMVARHNAAVARAVEVKQRRANE